MDWILIWVRRDSVDGTIQATLDPLWLFFFNPEIQIIDRAKRPIRRPDSLAPTSIPNLYDLSCYCTVLGPN